MSQRQIPASAQPDLQQALHAIWDQLDTLGASGRTVDLKGRRVANAGRALAPEEYATKAQVATLVKARLGEDVEFRNLTVEESVRILGMLFLPRLTDGSAHHVILFVDANGRVSGVNDGGVMIAFNDVAGLVELGYATRIKWVSAQASIGSPADGVINVLDNAATSFLRFVLGLDDGTGIALKKNGTTLELRVAGAAGGLTDLTIHNLSANNVPTNGGNAAFNTLVVGTDPGGADPLRVGGGIRLNGGLRIADTKLMRTDSAFTNGAGAATGTLGNAPAATDPTKWIPVDDAGTTRYIPAW